MDEIHSPVTLDTELASCCQASGVLHRLPPLSTDKSICAHGHFMAQPTGALKGDSTERADRALPSGPPPGAHGRRRHHLPACGGTEGQHLERAPRLCLELF